MNLSEVRDLLVHQSDEMLEKFDNSDFGKQLDEIHKEFFEKMWEAINTAQKIEIKYLKSKQKN